VGKRSGECFEIASAVTVEIPGFQLVVGYNPGMAVDSTLNVSLTPELEKFVEARVATGRYENASDVVREGLRLLENQIHDRETAFEALRAKLERSAAQAERGELIDPDDVWKLIEKRREALARHNSDA